MSWEEAGPWLAYMLNGAQAPAFHTARSDISHAGLSKLNPPLSSTLQLSAPACAPSSIRFSYVFRIRSALAGLRVNTPRFLDAATPSISRLAPGHRLYSASPNCVRNVARLYKQYNEP